ncbi:hypothetical protein R1sor_007070 [Riccia sorocarpa]|uniref:Uncharacterized protein n=1 Tax=Riccia sorocarpa TaxID=122646 RepID=A0ABD3HSV2_9MARC
MDHDGDRYVGGSGPGILQSSCSPASSSSSSNSEIKPRAMARAVNLQKAVARHQMSRHDYELIVSYLEVPENFAKITGSGRKTKIEGKNWTKVTAFGHMTNGTTAHARTEEFIDIRLRESSEREVGAEKGGS